MSSVTVEQLAEHLGLRNYSGWWRGNCPCCGYAKGAFSLRQTETGRISLWCANGCDRGAINQAISKILGGSWTPPKRHKSEQENGAQREQKIKLARELWVYCQPAAGTHADVYLTRRGLPGLAASQVLRFAPFISHPTPYTCCFPAMVALVTDAADNLVAVHRTYLAGGGFGKASITPSKASLGPVFGGAIRLDPLAPEIVVGEGIETAASAGRLLQLPAWAAICAGNLGKRLVLPPEVRKVWIAADSDPTGLKGAEEARVRWRAEGRKVRIATPDLKDQDFNDVLQARQAKEAV
jgi:putative DNA primase/helicase